ncbi:hypothetical protein CL633_00770 [bacterium]|nr:hypothetical protein [bacterium]|tara:strand:+ start:674 stop:1471 length:798 start_codon:yes stop_codon:yes gene_type:complete
MKVEFEESYHNFENTKGELLFGVLGKPVSTRYPGKLPCLIMCHGLRQNCHQRKFVELSWHLAYHGIASFGLDFAGHGQSSGDLEDSSIINQVDDLGSAYQYLKLNREKFKIDLDRIAFLGHSLGALIAVLFQAQYLDAAKTLILLAPALHQRELIKEWHTPEEIKSWKECHYLDTKKGRIGLQYFKEAVSRNWADEVSNITVRTLMISGDQDDDVPLEYNQHVYGRFSDKIASWEHVSHADHNFESYRAKEDLNFMVLKWLNRFL